VADKAPEDLYDDHLANEMYGERAAVREYDGCQSRCEAERLAVQDVRRSLGLLPRVSSGVSSKGKTHE
jgi:hypothetical protein